MKKIKTFNKLLSSLTLLSPLSGIGFNNQYQNTQKVITENYNNSLNNYFSSNAQEKMGDITVNVEGTVITGYVEGEGTLQVASNITEIGKRAFSEVMEHHIFSLDLSQATSLTTIRQDAFYSTEKLAGTISIPSSVTSIEQNAFMKMNYYSTTDEMILDLSQATSLTTIGEYAFAYCWNLTGNLVIPSGLETLGSKAFLGTKLTSVTIDDGNQHFSLATNLGPDACVVLAGTEGIWKDNSKCVGSLALGKLVIPSSVTSIGDSAFAETQINSLNLSQTTSLTTIGNNAFQSCSNLTGELYIPKNLNNIPSSAFRGTHFTSFTVDPENQHFSLATNLGPEAQVLLTDNTGILDAEFSNILTPFVSGTIELLEDITIIPDSLFHYICGDIILDFKNCINNIQSIGTNFALSSEETKVNIKNLDIANMINLQEIKKNAFVGPNFLDPFKLDFRNLENKITISDNIFSSDEKNFLPIVGDVVFPKLIDNIPSNILVSSEPLTGDSIRTSKTSIFSSTKLWF